MPEENNSGRNLIIAIVVIVIIAVVAAIWLSVRGGSNTTPAGQTASLGFEAAKEANAGATLQVDAQFPGSVVYVANASLPAGGWIVVRANEGGKPGAVLGATFFSTNTHIGNVELSTPTVDGQNYFVEVYTDDGDGQFDATKDALVMKADGTPLRLSFMATKNLPEIKG